MRGCVAPILMGPHDAGLLQCAVTGREEGTGAGFQQSRKNGQHTGHNRRIDDKLQDKRHKSHLSLKALQNVGKTKIAHNICLFSKTVIIKQIK
jgi:hypothetical protein